MRKYNELIYIVLGLLVTSCNPVKKNDIIAISKREILKTEKEFEACVKQKGLVAAFTKYAAEDAVLNRGDKLVKGGNKIKEFYENKNTGNCKLEWDADFVDVAASCDLGYTYGKYTYTVIDSTGRSKEYTGIFHTVWKKQTNGIWKFVWD